MLIAALFIPLFWIWWTSCPPPYAPLHRPPLHHLPHHHLRPPSQFQRPPLNSRSRHDGTCLDLTCIPSSAHLRLLRPRPTDCPLATCSLFNAIVDSVFPSYIFLPKETFNSCWILTPRASSFHLDGLPSVVLALLTADHLDTPYPSCTGCFIGGPLRGDESRLMATA